MPTSTAIVRRAEARDREALSELWRMFMEEQTAQDDRFHMADDAVERWQNDYPSWIEDETQRLLVAQLEERIVGFVKARRWAPPPVYEESEEVYLEELYVKEEARRKGVGTQLVEAIKKWAVALGAERLRLQVLSKNSASRNFWETFEAQPFTETATVELEGTGKERQERRRIGFW